MRTLLFIPIVLLLIAAGCWGAAVLLGWKLSPRDLILATVICVVSGELALTPAALLRKSDAATVSQAGLAGTVVHMFLTLLLAAMVWMGHLIQNQRLFLFLLLAFFWASLIVLVLAMTRLVRGATQPPAK